MGKKKRNHPDAEEILSRPWCYYCERDFDDLKILIAHQKAKHYKCERCGRRLNTAGGLRVHLNQVHKENLTTVENALPNRANPEIEIFGMEGIPEDVLTTHNQRVLSQFHQAEAERRAATGNTGPGGAGSKKPKVESPAELKKRLAEHKAKMAQQAGGGDSGGTTPVGTHQGMPNANVNPNSHHGNLAGAPSYAHAQPNLGGSPTHGAYSTYAQPYNMSGSPFQQPQPAYSPPVQIQNPHDFQNTGIHGYTNQQFPPVQPYSAPSVPGNVALFSSGSNQYGSKTSPAPFSQYPQQPPRSMTPPQTEFPAYRPQSLSSAASGLPQRPVTASTNAFALQPPHQVPVSASGPHPFWPPSNPGPPGTEWPGNNNLVSSGQLPLPASNNNFPDEGATIRSVPVQVPSKADDEVTIKKEKDKDKTVRLVYSDNEISPEEKMARLPRYAFTPSGEGETVLGEAATPAVTGTVDSAHDGLN